MSKSNAELARISSPCIGVCQLDPVSGYCRGCARTGDEIAAWTRMSDVQRLETLKRLAQRFVAISPVSGGQARQREGSDE